MIADTQPRGKPEIEALAYVDIQHDALSVFDDVEQGVVLREDIWISGYKAGESSVHGKARVEFEEGGGASLTAREGVRVVRSSKTNFRVSVPTLGLVDIPVRFPRQVVHPPYVKKTALTPPLHLNAIAHSPKAPQLVVGGPDGYAAILSTLPGGGETLELKGHVGDVLDVKWFPSGEVVLTASSDLSVRVFGKDGVNPRILKGHTRAVTCLGIAGVGKQIVSGSKDGTVRVWDVGAGREHKRWEVEGKPPVESLILVDDEDGKLALGVQGEERVVLAATQPGDIFVWGWSQEGGSKPLRKIERPADQPGCLSFAYDPSSGTLATGHANGVICLRHISTLDSVPPKLVRRNESPIYSLAFAHNADEATSVDLLAGTAAGLPCRLVVKRAAPGDFAVAIKEEYAGWEAVGVECWAVDADGKDVWCAGGEGGIRRY